MLTTALVKAIEDHREGIATEVIREIRLDPTVPVVNSLPDLRIRDWGPHLIEGFRMWVERNLEVCAKWCYDFGRCRHDEHIPLLELLRIFHISRERVVSYLRSQGFEYTPLDIYIEEEIEHSLAGFFDFAVYHAVRAYEDARQQNSAHEEKKEQRKVLSTATGWRRNKSSTPA